MVKKKYYEKCPAAFGQKMCLIAMKIVQIFKYLFDFGVKYILDV